MGHLFGALIIGLSLALSSTVIADEVDQEARTSFSKGVKQFNNEKYAEALKNFKRAYKLKPKWKLLYNIGQCHAVLKQYGQAIDVFEQYLAEGNDDLPLDRRDWVLKELDRMRKMVGTVEVVGPDDVDVFVNEMKRGVTPIVGGVLLPAGRIHNFRFEQGGKVLGEKKARVRGGAVVSVKVPARSGGPLVASNSEKVGSKEEGSPMASEAEKSAASPPSSEAMEEPGVEGDGTSKDLFDTEGKRRLRPALFWSGVGVTGAFGVGVLVMNRAVEKAGKERIDKDGLGRIETMQSLGLVFLATAGTAAVATTVISFFTDFGESEEDTESLALGPWATRRGAGLNASWRF